MMSRVRVLIAPVLFLVVIIAVTQTRPSGGALYALWAAIVLWPFVYGPIARRPRMARPFDPPIVYFDPAVHTLPVWAHAFLRDMALTLATEGFTVQNALVGMVTPQAAVWSAVLENPASGDVALLYASWTRLGVSNVFVGFRSAFADGREVGTTNHRNRSTLERPPPNRAMLYAPDMRDAIALYRLHCAYAATVHAPRAPLSCNGDPLAFQRAEARASAEHLVASGRFVRDEPRKIYRATWRAAIGMAWRNTFPIRQIASAVANARTRALRRELGALPR